MPMRAVGVAEFGGPEALSVHEVPIPEPEEGQIRIRVMAAGVNPADALLRSGALAARLTAFAPPYLPGMDACGTVDALGAGVEGRLSVGESVVAIAQPSVTGGAYAEYVVVAAGSAVRAPANVDPAAAATLLMNAQTARMALNALALDPGDVVAVTGAAGAVGGYAVQLAVADGLTVVADAGAGDEEEVRALGATHVVPRGPEFAAHVRQLYPSGVQGLVDGANQREEVVDALADGGGFATVKNWVADLERGIHTHVVWVAEGAADTASLERLRDQAEAGILTMRVACVLPPDGAADAHRSLEAGGLRGRQVLDFS